MPLEITPYSPNHVASVLELNARFAKLETAYHFPESPVPVWLPKLSERKIFQEFFVASDAGTVRGGYIFKRQDFWLQGKVLSLGNLSLPLSEGFLDPKYVSLGVSLYLHAIKHEPRMYVLGIGYREEPFAKLLVNAGWTIWDVPFFVKIIKPSRALRNIGPLRRTATRRCILDALAFTGIGSLAVRAGQYLLSRKHRQPVVDYRSESFTTFDTWVNELWQETQQQYSLSAVRDAETLNILYPESSRFLRLRVVQSDHIVGWATMLCTQMRDHKFFGNLKVGTVVDCDALPEAATAVVLAAEKRLREAGAEIVLTNQAHENWQAAVRAAGFVERPSNFLFAVSKKFKEVMNTTPEEMSRIHWTRGDGNGPFNL